MATREDILAALKATETTLTPELTRAPSVDHNDFERHTSVITRMKELDSRERALKMQEEEMKATKAQQDLRNRHILEKAATSKIDDPKCEEVPLRDDLKDEAALLMQEGIRLLGDGNLDASNLTHITSALMMSEANKSLTGADKKSVVMFVLTRLATTKTNDLSYTTTYINKAASSTIDELYTVGRNPAPFKPPEFREPQLREDLIAEADDIERKAREYLGDKKAGPDNMIEITDYMMRRAGEKHLEGKDKKDIVRAALSRIGRAAAGGAANAVYNSVFVSEAADSAIETLFNAAGKSALYHLIDPVVHLNQPAPDAELGRAIRNAEAEVVKEVANAAQKACCVLM